MSGITSVVAGVTLDLRPGMRLKLPERVVQSSLVADVLPAGRLSLEREGVLHNAMLGTDLLAGNPALSQRLVGLEVPFGQSGAAPTAHRIEAIDSTGALVLAPVDDLHGDDAARIRVDSGYGRIFADPAGLRDALVGTRLYESWMQPFGSDAWRIGGFDGGGRVIAERTTARPRNHRYGSTRHVPLDADFVAMNPQLRRVDASGAMADAIAKAGRVEASGIRLHVADRMWSSPGWKELHPTSPERAPSEHAYVAAMNVGTALADYRAQFLAAGLPESAWPVHSAKVTVNGFDATDNARSLFNPRKIGHVSFDRAVRREPFGLDPMVARHEGGHLVIDQLSRTGSKEHESAAVNEGVADALALLSGHLSGDVPPDWWRVVIRDVKEIVEHGTSDGERYATRLSQYDPQLKPHRSGSILTAAVYRMHEAGVPEQDLSNVLMRTIADPRWVTRDGSRRTALSFDRTAEVMLEQARAAGPGSDPRVEAVRTALQQAELTG